VSANDSSAEECVYRRWLTALPAIETATAGALASTHREAHQPQYEEHGSKYPEHVKSEAQSCEQQYDQ